MKCAALSLLLLLTLSLLAPTPAHSQQEPSLEAMTTAEQAELDRLLREGLSLYDLKRYGDALEQFRRAYTLFPHHDVLFKIAQCEEGLGEARAALKSYAGYVARAPEEERAVALERIRALEAALPGQLQIVTRPPGARVIIDGLERGVTPLAVDARGEVTFQLLAQGYAQIEQTLTIPSNTTQTIHLTLTPSAKPTPAQDASSLPPLLAAMPPLERGVFVSASAATLGAVTFWTLAGVESARLGALKDEPSRPASYDQRFYRRNGYASAALLSTALAAGAWAGWGALKSKRSAPQAPRAQAPLTCSLLVAGALCRWR